MNPVQRLSDRTTLSHRLFNLPVGWAMSALGWTVLAFALSWNISQILSISKTQAFLWILPDFALLAFFTPVIFQLVSHFPIERGHWKIPLLVQGITCMCLLAACQVIGLLGLSFAPVMITLPESGTLAVASLPPRPLFGPHFLCFLVISSIAHALYFYRKVDEREKAALEMDALLAKSRLQALRMQIQPHFLFNALNALSSFILSDPKSADRMLSSICAFLRLTLDAQPDEMVPLVREIEFAQKYLEIEKVRFQGRLQYEIACDPALHGVPVPALILQPLVENAVRHGIAGELDGGMIRI